MTIKIPNLRVQDLPPARNVGLEGIELRLQACEESLAKFAGAPHVAPLITAIDAVRAPMPALIEATRLAMSTFMKQASAAAAAGNAAAAKVATKTTGFSTPKEREAAIAGARTAVADAVWDSTVAAVAEQRSAQATKFAEDAVTALREADRVLTAASAEYTGPMAFATGMTMDRLSMISALRDELKVMKPLALGPLLDGYIASGDEEREVTFIQAVVPVLDELAKMSITQLGRRLEMRPTSNGQGALEKEREAVFELRKRIIARQEERVPDSLALAKLAYGQIVSCFSVVFGFHASQLSKGDYEQRFLRVSGGSAHVLDVHPSWLSRNIANFSVEDR